jgi:hypothetical protein
MSDDWINTTRLSQLDMEEVFGTDDDVIEDVTPLSILRPASATPLSGTSPMFATPSSQMSGATGGVQGKTFVCGLISVVRTTDLCGGVISGARGVIRFCAKNSGSCRVKNHGIQKANLEPNKLYMKTKRTGQGRLEPNVSTARLPATTNIATLLDKLNSPEVWSAYFASLNAKRDRFEETGLGDDESWQEVGTQSLADLSKVERTFQTPKRLKMGSLLTASVDVEPGTPFRMEPLRVMEEIKNALEEEAVGWYERSVSQMAGEWPTVNENFENIEKKMETMDESHRFYHTTVTRSITDLQGAVSEADSRAQLLSARLGQLDSDEEDFSTIWQAIEHLRKEIKDTNEELESMKANIPDYAKFVSDVKMTLPVLNSNIDVILGSFKAFSEKTKEKLAAMDSKISAELGRRVNRTSMGGVVPRAEPTFKSDVDSLKIDVSDMKEELEEHGRLIGELNGNSQQDNINGSDLGPILDRLKEMESRVTGESFIEDGYTFGSAVELATWCETEKVETSGVFWDIFSVLVVMSPKHMTGKEKADSNYSSIRTDTSNFENEQAASMSHVRPGVLYGKKDGSIAPLDAGFAACNTYKAWIGGSESYKSTLNQQLTEFISGVRGVMGARRHAGASGLARLLLGMVQVQWSQLIGFMDEFFIDLTEVAKFPKDKAWNLVGRCVAAIFEAMRPFRARVQLMEESKTLEAKTAYIWAVLQCHRVMNEFVAVRFRGHPMIVKAISLFMIIERVDPGELLLMTERLKKSEHDLDKAKKEIKALEEGHKTHLRNWNNVVVDLKRLKDKVG